MATSADADAELAMHRPSALMTLRSDAPLSTPKKRWMLMWRQQEQQQPQDIMEPEQETETETFHGLLLPDKSLRVETPGDANNNNGDPSSASLSPLNANANVPSIAAASISPSSKAKEAETGAAARSRTPSPVKILQDKHHAEEEEEGEEMDCSLTAAAAPLVTVRTTSSSSAVSTATSTESLSDDLVEPEPMATEPIDPEKKRARQEELQRHNEDVHSVEEGEEEDKSELTESERQRLERRKRRKTNWDVGDPRKHGGSLDIAALNLLSSTNPPATHPASFAKFPRHRPVYRQSHSMDAPQRGTVFGNSTVAAVHGGAAASSLQSPPRRPFHQSHSLPLERPRTARPLPPATRFPPNTNR